jgi:hypothetical protein
VAHEGYAARPPARADDCRVRHGFGWRSLAKGAGATHTGGRREGGRACPAGGGRPGRGVGHGRTRFVAPDPGVPACDIAPARAGVSLSPVMLALRASVPAQSRGDSGQLAFAQAVG